MLITQCAKSKFADLTMRNLSPVSAAVGEKPIQTGEKSEQQGIPKLLSGILYNLSDNAIKYNHTDGNIDIRSAADKGTTMIITLPKEGGEKSDDRL